MRYFLSSLLDKNTRDYIRDRKRDLAKYKRNFEFVPIEYLHQNYKYLGKNLLEIELQNIVEDVTDFINTANLRAFTHPISKLRFGKQGELSPKVLHMDLKNTESLNVLDKALHEAIIKSLNPNVPRRKDNNQLLNTIKIAQLQNNMGQSEIDDLFAKLKNFKQPEDTLIDNFVIIGTEINRNKVRYTVSERINLKKST
jgi:2'-5' RNA ligase